MANARSIPTQPYFPQYFLQYFPQYLSPRFSASFPPPAAPRRPIPGGAR
jgi:hypothetical protein